ncbi:MAG: alpha/beta fold hydrolase [Thiotrichaceae bacterium]
MKLVLLPGLDGTGHLFTPLLEHLDLSIQTQIITYPSDKQLSLTELAHLICEQVHFDDSTTLLAESFSGLVALELLRLGKLSSLQQIIFCASFTTPPRPWLLKIALQLPLDKLLNLPIPALALRQYGLGRHGNKKEIQRIQQAISMVQPKVLAHRLKIISASRPMLTEKLSVIPCHYLQAQADKLVLEHHAKLFQQYFSHVSIYTIPQAGHFLLQSQPKACADIIKAINR